VRAQYSTGGVADRALDGNKA